MEAIKRIIEDSALTIHINRDKRDQVFEFMEDQEKEIKDLQAQNEAKTKVNMFLSCEWNGLCATQSVAETLGLDPKTANDTAILQLSQRYMDLIGENEKLKSEAEDTKRLLTTATNHGGVLRRQNQELKEGLKDYEQHAILEEDINDFVETVLGQKLVDRKEYIELKEFENALVPNFFTPEHFPEMKDWSDELFEKFKKRVESCVIGGDDFVREGVQEILDNFIEECGKCGQEFVGGEKIDNGMGCRDCCPDE